MKKIVLAIILLLFIMYVPAYADDASPKTFTFAPAIEGQFIYDAQSGAIVPAIGLQLVKGWDDVLEGRILATGSREDLTTLHKVGVGVGCNLPALANKAGGEWVAKVINPSVGLAILYDMNNRTDSPLGWGVYVAIIKVEF